MRKLLLSLAMLAGCCSHPTSVVRDYDDVTLVQCSSCQATVARCYGPPGRFITPIRVKICDGHHHPNCVERGHGHNLRPGCTRSRPTCADK